MDQRETFEYFISEKNGFVVASLVGSVTSFELFAKMNEEIFQAEFDHLVLNLRDVVVISRELFPLLAKLQKQARDLEANLRICGLKPELREKLRNAGILRPHELADNLATALQSIVSSPIAKRAS